MAKTTVKVTGLDDALNNINEAIKKIDGNVHAGIRAAAVYVKGEAQSLTPVDEGILRNSAFYRSFKGNETTDPFAVIGYTAFYAPYVHEAPMSLKGKPRADFGKTGEGVSFGGGSGKGFYWDGGENKFLQKAVRDFTKIINIITKFAGRDIGTK